MNLMYLEAAESSVSTVFIILWILLCFWSLSLWPFCEKMLLIKVISAIQHGHRLSFWEKSYKLT